MFVNAILTKVDETVLNNHGINIGYTKMATLTEFPKIGEHFKFGSLLTTPVTELTEDGFKTKNSTYSLKLI